ncbi:MAG: AMP-binding protein, partial [Pyrinomonadaceae bacterium]
MSDITEVLALRAREQPSRVAYSVIADGEISSSVTYLDLDQRARAVAAKLHAMRAAGAVLLLYPSGSGLDFITSFFGCLYAGVIAVPLFPPRRHRSDPRVASIAMDTKAQFGLTTSGALLNMDPPSVQQTGLDALRWVATDELVVAPCASTFFPRIENKSLAYLQYTSGSTSAPKGVMVSHSGLLHTLLDLDRGWVHDSNSVMVTWLPLYHDMGLIYGILQPLFTGFTCYLMDPAAFLQHPVRWLEAISRFGGTHSAAPNFAFDLCVRSVTEAEKASLNLCRWQVVLNAAEPVRTDTLQSFAAAFDACGFKPEIFCPGYGLAEATLKVTAVRRGLQPGVLRVRAEALSRGRVEAADDGASDATTLVSCGISEVGARIAIVDPETLIECTPGHVGEIWVSGDSVAQG